MRKVALETTDTYCTNIYNKLGELTDNGIITKEKVENFYLYVLSAHASIEKLPHKITRKTALVLRELVDQMHQELSKPAEGVVWLDTDQIMSPATWQRLRTTIHEARQTIFSLFWVRGATWSDIDTRIAAEVRQGACEWPRDRSEHGRKTFLQMGSSGVTVALEKGTLQYLVFECTQGDGKELMTVCTNQMDYKSGVSMVTGGTLSLDRLQLTFLSSPTIDITWRKHASDATTIVDEKTIRTALMLHFDSAKGI